MRDKGSTASVTMERVSDNRVWVKVALSLGQEEYVGGDLCLKYAADFYPAITPLNEEAARAFEEQAAQDAVEDAENGEGCVCGWAGYIAQGARQGFRLRKTPDRLVTVRKLEGCLGLDGDVEGIIWTAELAVVFLLGGDLPQARTPGWTVKGYAVNQGQGGQGDSLRNG